jgi:putative membrane protein
MDFCDLIVSMEQGEISPRPVVGAIVVVSGLAVSFLLWLLYVHRASADFAGRWMFLPTLNALLNGLCAIALCVGLYFFKHHNREAHRTSMLLAFAFSSVFLISYIVNHALHGDTIFPGHGAVRTLYLSILASHVILSVVALPMVLTTFFFSLTGRFAMHRRIARLTFPIWLYVSITGVVVFVFLKAYAYFPSVDRVLRDAKLRRHVHRRSSRFHLLQRPQSSPLRCVVPDMTLCDQSSGCCAGRSSPDWRAC